MHMRVCAHACLFGFVMCHWLTISWLKVGCLFWCVVYDWLIISWLRVGCLFGCVVFHWLIISWLKIGCLFGCVVCHWQIISWLKVGCFVSELDDKGDWHPWVKGAGAAGDALLQHQGAPFKGHDANDCAKKTGAKTFTNRLVEVRTPLIVKSHMEWLCYVNLPCRCLGGVYHPSVTMEAPLRAPKQAEIRSKQQSFPLSTL